MVQATRTGSTIKSYQAGVNPFMNQLSKSELNRLCNEVLSALEIRESRLLNWGFINGAQSLEDIDEQLPDLLRHLPENSPEIDAIWQKAKDAGIDGADILQNLCDRKLLFKPGSRYRSRFAETVRSLYLLRQRFSEDDWQTGERLVSDMKLLLQRRRYPRRNITSDAVIQQLEQLPRITPGSLRIIKQLLQEANGANLKLACFQAQSIVRILRNLHSQEESAVVIGAGTGSGKTKAFYIPALAHIADNLGAQPYLQALALYPRKELLKDQLRETFLEARKLDTLLREQKKRPITVGAYYGDVPYDAAEILLGRKENWSRTRDKLGWICPYAVCPECGKTSMIWWEVDLKKEKEDNAHGHFGRYALIWCAHCQTPVGSEHLLLTRRQMATHPPDILFTTTEMLNRRLSNPAEHHLFGIGAENPPQLLLMDEIHLNEGIHGAQVAHLLRRWRYLRGEHASKGLCMVGLSATLSQAETFFSRLTGVPLAQTSYITPAEQDLVQEGLEYNLVLKGDPSSGTTLLSTSVRTAMLLCRILDPFEPSASGSESISGGAYGHRVFAFSDKLDVINRWYHIEKEVENPTEPYVRYLAVSNSSKTSKARYLLGQNWWFVSEIHGNSDVLNSGLRLDITSSQYEGVDRAANLVIASSTLEVGYNDPTVGAILQHKTPFSRAAFLQRKGRAGRQRDMRPWMVLVASAYGHDRWAFQHADVLFDPVLPPLNLPLENYYVRKIQATYVLLDWLALQLKRENIVVDMWWLLRSDRGARDLHMAHLRPRAAVLLRNLLEDDNQTNRFKEFVRNALGIQEDDEYAVDLLLWGEPRPLLYEVIPSLVRQLESDWQTIAFDEEAEWITTPWSDAVADRPLPDFLPAALFSDLKSPDMVIRIPDHRPKQEETVEIRAEEPLSLALALAEYTPGKVNKRFARKDKIRESHWLELPEVSHIIDSTVALEDLQIQFAPDVISIDVGGRSFSVLRPAILTLSIVPSHVRPTSSSRPIWESHFLTRSQRVKDSSPQDANDSSCGVVIPFRSASPWRKLIESVHAYTQVNDAWVEVTRLATGVDVHTRYEMGGERRATYQFSASGQPAAIGFQVDVDALEFVISPLDGEKLRNTPEWDQLYRLLGAHYFRHCLQQDENLRELKLSDLEMEWIWQLELTMITWVAIEQQLPLDAASAYVDQHREALAGKVLAIIFRNQPMDKVTQTETEEGGTTEKRVEQLVSVANETEDEEEKIGFLQAKILQQISAPLIQSVLKTHVSVLWDDQSIGLEQWLQTVYTFTFGAAIFSTLVELTPDVNLDDLHLDIVNQSIWISEAAAGGVGLIAKIADTLTQYPRRFDLQLKKALMHCDREQLAYSLDAVAALISGNHQPLQNLFQEIRHSSDLPQIEKTRRTLSTLLDAEGIVANRQLGSALNTKFLRPNSGTDTDHLVAELVSFWQREESRLRCAIDLRIIAAIAPQIEPLGTHIADVLSRIGENNGRDDAANLAYNLAQSLLWTHCHDSCPDCIERPQRYQNGPKPSRALLLALADLSEENVQFNDADWQQMLNDQLATAFQAQLYCTADELTDCVTQIRRLLTTPIEVGYQHAYPIIERIERNEHSWLIHLILPDLIEE